MNIVDVYKHITRFYKKQGLPLSAEHKRYMKQVCRDLVRRYPRPEDDAEFAPYSPLLVKLFLLDLEPVRPLWQSLYSAKPRGTPPRDPIRMLRAWLAMLWFTELPRITAWVATLRSQPTLAVLCDFTPGDTPGVGTFYDFAARLDPERTDPILRKPQKKPTGEDSDRRPRPGRVKHLVDQVLRRKDQPLPLYPTRTLQQLLKPFVLRSAALGLLGDPQALALSGDGTKFLTGARRLGRRVCACSQRDQYRCDCPRRYTDRFATWGYDSYRECYIFGHAYYELTTADSPYDLPVFIELAQAKTHDSANAVKTFDRARKLYPEFRIASLRADSAHDNYPFYSLLATHSVTPFIARNDRHKGHFQLNADFTTTATGVPVCPAGLSLTHAGFCPDRSRIKWRCPLAALGARLPCACSDRSYGRVFYTKPADDPRLFTQPPRASRAWKTEYAQRTTVERSHKRKKIDYHLELARCRSRRQWAVRIFLTALAQHVDAWADRRQTQAA